VKACNLHRHLGEHITTIGWLVTGKTVQTKDGDPMKFVFFEDTAGNYETVLFPKVYDRFCHMLRPSPHRSGAECILSGLSAEGASTGFGFDNTSPDWRIEALNEMRPYLLKGKVEQDFTALTLPVNGTEFPDRSIQGSAYKHTDKASPLHLPCLWCLLEKLLILQLIAYTQIHSDQLSDTKRSTTGTNVA